MGAGLRLPYKLPSHFPLNPAVTGLVFSGRGVVRRISLRNTSAANPATVQLFDGTSTGGTLLDSISLAPSESCRDNYRHGEYPFYGSLYLNLVSGAVEGNITGQYIGPGEPELEAFLAITLADIAAAEAAATAPPAA